MPHGKNGPSIVRFDSPVFYFLIFSIHFLFIILFNCVSHFYCSENLPFLILYSVIMKWMILRNVVHEISFIRALLHLTNQVLRMNREKKPKIKKYQKNKNKNRTITLTTHNQFHVLVCLSFGNGASDEFDSQFAIVLLFDSNTQRIILVSSSIVDGLMEKWKHTKWNMFEDSE